MLVIISLVFAHQSKSQELSEDLKNAVRAYVFYFKEHKSNDPNLTSAFDLRISGQLSAYLMRWFKYTGSASRDGAPEDILFSAFVYLTRLRETKITSRNITRLSLVALLLASKFHSDFCFSNGHYAVVGNIRNEQLVPLERHFIKDVDHRLFIDEECIREAKYFLLENFYQYLLLKIEFD